MIMRAILILLLCACSAFAGQGMGPGPGVKAYTSGGGSGALMLGTDSIITSADEHTGNPNTAYPMSMAAAAGGAVARAWFYDRLGYETDPVKVCIWNASGTLLGCSPAIAMLAAPGWASADWSGPTLVQGTSYIYSAVVGGAAGFFTNQDTTTPAHPQMDSAPTVTYGSEGNITPGTFNGSYGSQTIYVTN